MIQTRRQQVEMMPAQIHLLQTLLQVAQLLVEIPRQLKQNYKSHLAICRVFFYFSQHVDRVSLSLTI